MFPRRFTCYILAALSLLLVSTPLFAQQVLRIDPRTLGMENIRLISPAREAIAVQSAAANVSLRTNEFLIGRSETPIQHILLNDTARFTLPYKIVGADRSGALVKLSPVIEVGGGGFRFDPNLDAFVGNLFIGLQDELKPEQASPLARAVRMLVTAAADSVGPASVLVNHTNLPFLPVEIVVRRPEETVSVRLRPEFDAVGMELAVPVRRPSLRIEVSPPNIQGLGLETADVTVSAQGAAINGPITVRLSSSGARPEPPTLMLEGSGTASATIRSRGLGSAELTASSDILQSATATVNFEAPWGFAIAAIAGGLVGGFLRFLMPLIGTTKKLRPRELALQVALGSLAGILTASAYAVGLNFLDVSPSAVVGEALVFTIAALGALASSTLFPTALAARDQPG